MQDENKEQQPCYTGARKMMSSAKKAEIREGICQETNEVPWQKKVQISKKEKKQNYAEEKSKIQKKSRMVKALGKNRRSASLNKQGRMSPIKKVRKVSRVAKLSKKILKEKNKKSKDDEEIVHWVQCESCY